MENLNMDTDIKELYFGQRLWINKMRFYKDQLAILQNNLDKLVKFFPHPEVMSDVEQYQNKIIVYNDVADRLIKDYKMLRNKTNELNGSAILEDQQQLLSVQIEMENKASNFVRYFDELKNDFLIFYTSHNLSENHVCGKKAVY